MASLLLPPSPTPVSHVEILHPPLIIDEGCQEPVHDTDDQRTEHRGPEAVHVKSRYHPCGHFEHHGVDHKSEKAKGQYVDGESKEKQDRTEEGVQDSQNCGREKSTEESPHHDSIEQVGCDHNRGREHQPSY